MKAKNLFKKSLAWMLTLVLIVLSVPMAAFVVSAEATVAPTPDATDIGSYVDFYQSTALYNEYNSTGSIKTNTGEYVTYGDNYTADGTYYASVKMTFDPYFEYKFVANEETGKWERGAGNAGIVWGQTGIKIGTYVTGERTSAVSVVYRKGQRGFYLMDSAGTPVANLGASLNGGGDYTNVVLTVKYDSAAKLLTAWIKGDDNEVIATNVIDMSAIESFEFTGFDLRCGSGGAHPADMNDITNTETVLNYVTFSDLHIWGNVYTTKSFMTPSIGNNKNLANGLTLSDATANADWKADGEFTWNYNNVFFNGMDFVKGAGQIVYASVTMSNLFRSGGNDIYGVAFATQGGSNNSFNYVRPSWNQQGVTLAGFVSRVDTEGWGDAGGDGTFKNHDGDQVVIYAYDVDNGTVDIWLKTAIYQSHNPDHYIAPYQDIYVGKYSLGQSVPALGLVVGGSANLENLTAPITVKDVKVWTNGATESLTAGLTLSDSALNETYKTTGQITIDSTTDVVYLNGVETQQFVGQKIYYYFTAQFSGAANAVVPGSGAVNPAMVFAADASGNIAGFGHKPTWNQSGKLGGVTWNNIHFDATGSGNSSETKPNEYLVIYDVDTATAECWMNIQDRAVIDDGWLKMATATVNNGYAFKLGISGRNVTGGTLTVTNIAVATTKSSSIDTTNKLAGLPAYEGGFLNSGIAYNNTTDLGVSNTPVWTVGETVNNTGVYTSLKQGGYDGKKTVVWKGLKGDLSKGTVVYEADFTIYNKTTGWNGTNWGLIVATVDGHYIHTGFGIHGAAGASYKNGTFVDGSNVGEQSGANTAFLGSAWGGSYSVAGTETGVTVHVTAVLTATSLTTYINGAVAQSFNFTGKTVVPQFGIAWGSGNPKDTISNVKAWGDGVEVCTHTYDGCDDTTCNDCGLTRAAGEHTYTDANDAYCDVCNAERVLFTLLFKNGQLNANYAAHVSGATVPESLALTPSQFAIQSLVFGGAQFDLSKGSYTIEADFKVTTNTSMESHFGITAVVMNGDIYTFGVLANGNWGENPTPTQTYVPYVRKNNNNTLVSATGDSVTATDAGATINLKVTVDAEKATYYINGTVSYELFFAEAESVAPFAAFTTRGANVEVSNVKLTGTAAKNCTHSYDNACDATCNLCGAVREVNAHVYDNDYDADCNNCGATRTPPATALPTIGENTNFAGDLVFENAGVNAEYAENGTVTTSGLNGKANGVLLGENGVAYIKTDITFNGNVDWNWVEQKDAETGEGLGTYAYKEAWGRTGVQIGTYYSTGRERRMSVYVTYRRCTGGVYVWDDSQEVNGNGNPVVVGNITKNKEALSFVIRYDSVANNVTVWADGAYVGTASLEKFGEFEFALGVTQYGSGTTAVDPADNTNPETTANNVTFANFEVWGDLTATCVHEYDNACDADCNKCFEEREVPGHVYDNDCADTDCNNCGATRPAAEHVFDDCTDTTCANCGVTRPAAEHVYDDCQDTTCANCSATRPAADHVYDDDCQDTTCANCGVTRPAAEHVFDDDCQDTTCANCSATRPAADHVYDDDCQDTTCANCGVTRPAADHVYDDDYDPTCNNCSHVREVSEKPDEIVIGSGDTQDKFEVAVGEVLPVLEKVGTKFVLGWTNSLGEVVETYNGETDLVADYVETLMMTVKYQVGTDGDSIRYIASVDQTERYTKVGWAFSLVNANPEIGAENVVVRDSSLVYQGLLADGEIKTAADIYGGADYAQYLYVFEITDIPEAAADSTIYVRPYVEMNDGTIVYGEVYSESLNTIKAK